MYKNTNRYWQRCFVFIPRPMLKFLLFNKACFVKQLLLTLLGLLFHFNVWTFQLRILNSQFGRVHFVWFITKVHIYFPLIQGSAGRSVNHHPPYLNCVLQDNWWWTQDQGSNQVDLWGGLCLWGGGRLVLTSVNQPTLNLKNPPYSSNMRTVPDEDKQPK